MADRAERRAASCRESSPPLVMLPPTPRDGTPVQLQGSLEPALLHVRIAGFAALVELHARPALAGRQVIICDRATAGGTVLATLPAARARGVTARMPLRSAEKLCACPVVVEMDAARLLAVSQEVLAILGAYTPLVEPEWVDRTPDGACPDPVRLARGFGAWLDVRGCERLFGPAASIGYQLGRALSEQGYLAQVGIATNPSLAAVASALATPGEPVLVPAGQERTFLEHLPLWPEGAQDPLLDLDATLLEHLQALGIRRIGELARLPAASLRRRFGAAGVSAHAQARGEVARQLALPIVPKTLHAGRDLEDPCVDRQRLHAEIQTLATTLAAQLARRTWAARCLAVTLTDARGPHTRTLQLKRPVATAGEVRTLAMDVIAQLLPPAGSCGPVCALRLELSSFVPAAAQLALPLFGAGVQSQARDAVAMRLRSRFGPCAARRARLEPEAVLPEDQVVWDTPCRPSVRGPRMLAVRVDDTGAPCAVRRGRAWEAVRSIHSQWRIRTRWWADTAHRHYYVVETATGAVLELYRDLPEGPWTLSGRRD